MASTVSSAALEMARSSLRVGVILDVVGWGFEEDLCFILDGRTLDEIVRGQLCEDLTAALAAPVFGHSDQIRLTRAGIAVPSGFI